MADLAIKPAPIAASRMRALIVPREHGAWGMLLVPLVIGAATGLHETMNLAPLGLLTVSALALFWMRTPLETALGSSPMRAQSAAETNWLLLAIAALASVAMVCLALLLWGGQNRGLLLLGTIAGAALIAQALVKKIGHHGRMPAQLIGAIGLTATAPGAYYVVTGHLDPRAFGLWLANWIFAGNQIHFVQVRIHSARAAAISEKFARGRMFFAGQFVMIGSLALAWRFHLLPGAAFLAFVPVFVRGLLWFKPGAQPLMVKRLGWTELAHAVAFAALLIAAVLL